MHSRLAVVLGLVVKVHVILVKGRQEDDRLDAVKAVNPLASLTLLASDVDYAQPNFLYSEAVLGYAGCWQTNAHHVIIVGQEVGLTVAGHIGEEVVRRIGKV